MIDLERARELLKQAMETQGRDFVYCPIDGPSNCHYEPCLDEDGPKALTGCLVGTALTLAGETRHIGYGGIVTRLAESYPDMMTPVTREYFRVAQFAQDFGASWGEAYDRAEKYANSL